MANGFTTLPGTDEAVTRAGIDWTGDVVNFYIYASADDWSPAAEIDLFAQWPAATNHVLRCSLATDFKFRFRTHDNTSTRTFVMPGATGITDGEGRWIRIELIPDLDGTNSRCRMWYKDIPPDAEPRTINWGAADDEDTDTDHVISNETGEDLVVGARQSTGFLNEWPGTMSYFSADIDGVPVTTLDMRSVSYDASDQWVDGIDQVLWTIAGSAYSWTAGTHPFIPNPSDGDHDPQSEFDQQDFEYLRRGIAGTGVVEGCVVTQSATPAQTVDISAGTISVAGEPVAVSASTGLSITAAHATLDRLDVIAAGPNGAIVVFDGVAAAEASIESADIPERWVALAALYVPATDNVHGNTQISDKRIMVLQTGMIRHATVLVPSGGQANIDFTDIPAGRKIVLSGVVLSDRSGSNVDQVRMRLGNATLDTTSNYQAFSYDLTAAGTRTITEEDTTSAAVMRFAAPTEDTTDGSVGAIEIDIHEHSSGHHLFRPWTSRGGMRTSSTNADNRIGVGVGSWQSTDPITQVRLFWTNGDFAEGSHVTLWVLK